MNKGKDPDSKLELPNNSAGAALAFRAGIFELGATADYVDRGLKDPSSGYEAKRGGPALGGQAMIKPFKGFKAALRGSMVKLSGELDFSGNKSDFEGDNNEFGMRAEWQLESIPLTLAARWEKLIMTPEYRQGNSSMRAQAENRLKSTAAAFHFFGGRFLLGVELQELAIGYDVYTNNSFTAHQHLTVFTGAGGAEVWLLPWLGVRGSYKRMEFKNDLTGAESYNNTLGAGAGLKGESLSLDVSARKITGDNEVTKQDEFTDLKAVLGYRF
jgi:hypothetical protein